MGLYMALVAMGLIALLAGGDLLVRGAVGLAQRFGMSPMLIGLTLVGFGTSMPELLTSVQAALTGASGIALGNVVGSNIANILLVLGLAAVIAPFAAQVERDVWIMGAVSLLCAGIILGGQIGFVTGAVLVGLLALYLIVALRGGGPAEMPIDPPISRGKGVLVSAVGLALLLIGARALVSGAVGLASGLGVSQTVIGVTVVAIGTSLPELVTSVIAARKGQSALALGNVIGSNIFNVLGILGVTALVTPIAVPDAMAGLHLWVMLFAAAGLIAVMAVFGRIGRASGLAALGVYAIYLAWSAVAG